MSKLLIEDYPLLVSPKLAEKIGLNEAIFLQQIHYWLNNSSKVFDDKKWTYSSYKEWQEQLPFWSESTIKRIIQNLKNNNLLIVGNFNKAKFDKTNWYTINYEKVEELSTEEVNMTECDSSDSTKTSDDRVKMNQREGQIDPISSGQNEPTNTLDLSKTSSETYKNYRSNQNLNERFDSLWKEYPNKKGKEKAFKAYKKAIQEGVDDKVILEGIIRYNAEIAFKRTEQQYIAHGSTWFNQRRWNDEYEQVPQRQMPNYEIIDPLYQSQFSDVTRFDGALPF